jgi:hypothetical protein
MVAVYQIEGLSKRIRYSLLSLAIETSFRCPIYLYIVQTTTEHVRISLFTVIKNFLFSKMFKSSISRSILKIVTPEYFFTITVFISFPKLVLLSREDMIGRRGIIFV